MCNQLILAVIFFISFLRLLFSCPSCIVIDALGKKKKKLIISSQILYLYTHNFCTDSFLFNIKFEYAFWKQTELVNDWYILICRQMLNPKENFTEWKPGTCSLTRFIPLCICGNNRFSTVFCIFYSENCKKYWKHKIKFSLRFKNWVFAYFLIWGSNFWCNNNKSRQTSMKLWK